MQPCTRNRGDYPLHGRRNNGFFTTGKNSMKTVEYWRWRYRDKLTGRICRTMFQLTAEEAAEYPEAQRIEGSMVLRKVEDRGYSHTGFTPARADSHQSQQ